MCHHRPLHFQMTKWAHIWMWYDMYCSNVDVHIKYPWFAGMFSANILFWWLGRVTPLKQSENNVLFLRFTAFLSPTPLPFFIHCPARSTTGSGRRGQQIHYVKVKNYLCICPVIWIRSKSLCFPSWHMLHPSSKFHQNQASSCSISLLTNQQTETWPPWQT